MLLSSAYISSFILWSFRVEMSAVVESFMVFFSSDLLYKSTVTSCAVAVRFTIRDDEHGFQ